MEYSQRMISILKRKQSTISAKYPKRDVGLKKETNKGNKEALVIKCGHN